MIRIIAQGYKIRYGIHHYYIATESDILRTMIDSDKELLIGLAQLFDAHGDITWQQSGRNTVSFITIHRVSHTTALVLQHTFGAKLINKPRLECYTVRLSGSKGQKLAEYILPYAKELKSLLSFYIEARNKVMFSSSVGRGSTMGRDDLDFRHEIANEFRKMRQEAGLPRKTSNG